MLLFQKLSSYLKLSWYKFIATNLRVIFPVVYKSRLEQATNFNAHFSLRFFMLKLSLVAKPADEKEENISDDDNSSRPPGRDKKTSKEEKSRVKV